MSLTLTVWGDEPVTLPAYQLAGYHRPLGGEVASVTVTVAPDALAADWLALPPLGRACTVRDAAEPLLDGVLYSVRVTDTTVELGVEG